MVDIPSDDHQVRSNQDVMGLRFGGEADEEMLVEVRGIELEGYRGLGVSKYVTILYIYVYLGISIVDDDRLI
jgi:hypothetical protein